MAVLALFTRFVLLVISLFVPTAFGFAATIASPSPTKDVLDTKAFAETSTAILSTKDVVTNVVVAGATGRTGRYVVEELLNRGVTNVVALVRDDKKANEVFPNPPSNLQIVSCNFNNETQLTDIIESMQIDAAIWCATGFSTPPVGATTTATATTATPKSLSFIDQIKKALGLDVSTAPPPPMPPIVPSDMKQLSIDLIGLPAIAKSLVPRSSGMDDVSTSTEELPKLVMCSSAGVTRTIWDDSKKAKYIGAADIPIVRLNPFNILDRKRESEVLLRQLMSTVKYCIVRPCGLNDEWPVNSRPVFTQGDVAVGRLHRRDLAKLLVDTLSTPEALYKTFEVVGIANYPPAASGIGSALARLHTDREIQKLNDDGAASQISDDILFATYTAMQQLLPGEKQDAAALAMGQTYEQLDTGTVGRLGVRGQEVIDGAAPKPS